MSYRQMAINYTSLCRRKWGRGDSLWVQYICNYTHIAASKAAHSGRLSREEHTYAVVRSMPKLCPDTPKRPCFSFNEVCHWEGYPWLYGSQDDILLVFNSITMQSQGFPQTTKPIRRKQLAMTWNEGIMLKVSGIAWHHCRCAQQTQVAYSVTSLYQSRWLAP